MYLSADPSPPTSTSCPPDVIHVIGVPRPSPFFVLFRFHVLYWTQTKEQKTGEARERGYFITERFAHSTTPTQYVRYTSFLVRVWRPYEPTLVFFYQGLPHIGTFSVIWKPPSSVTHMELEEQWKQWRPGIIRWICVTHLLSCTCSIVMEIGNYQISNHGARLC